MTQFLHKQDISTSMWHELGNLGGWNEAKYALVRITVLNCVIFMVRYSQRNG